MNYILRRSNRLHISQVFFTKGSPQLWKATFKAGKLLNASNAASQDLDPSSREVVNSAEYFGRRLYVTASGTYEPLVRGRILTVPAACVPCIIAADAGVTFFVACPVARFGMAGLMVASHCNGVAAVPAAAAMHVRLQGV
jgi:hypothetical protein